MALQTSGAISLNDIHVEAGGTTGSQASINDSDIRGLIGKSSGAQMSFSEWYGATAETTLTSAGTVNGQNQRQEITVSSFISSGGTLVIPSSLWVWSDSTSTAALTIDIPCTVKVEGKVIGKGGAAGTNPWWGNSAGSAGGPAIKINSGVSGVTVVCASGGYIAGGGGGGGPANNGSSPGGGAGGGASSRPGESSSTVTPAAGGALNATGGTGLGWGYYIGTFTPGAGNSGGGGGAGGGGGHYIYTGADAGLSTGGGGGGRILPGTGGGGSTSSGGGQGGDGGSAGNAGSGSTFYGSGGGGGWGAAGGSGSISGSGGGTSGGSGGKAIDDSGVTYTLTNNGTIYGGT